MGLAQRLRCGDGRAFYVSFFFFFICVRVGWRHSAGAISVAATRTERMRCVRRKKCYHCNKHGACCGVVVHAVLRPRQEDRSLPRTPTTRRAGAADRSSVVSPAAGRTIDRRCGRSERGRGPSHSDQQHFDLRPCLAGPVEARTRVGRQPARRCQRAGPRL